MSTAKLLLIGTVAVLAVALGATPATGALTDDTTVTFVVSAGTLDIVAPASAALSAGAPGVDITGAIGPVTVADNRASADASWAATVTSSDFTTGGGTASETILATEVDYWSGPSTATTGTGTFTPGQATIAAAAPLNNVTPRAALTHVGGTGNNTAVWNPKLIVHTPLDSQLGTYSGTVTHSVA